MIKKIYALRNGNHPGIYEDYLDYYKAIKDLDEVDSVYYEYDTDIWYGDEYTLDNYDYAMRQARIFMGWEVDPNPIDESFDDVIELCEENQNEILSKEKAEAEKKDLELHEFFGIEKTYGNAWVDLILELSASNFSNGMQYSERYYPPKVYFFLMKLIFDNVKLVDTYIKPFDQSNSKQSDDDYWEDNIEHELSHSIDYTELKKHLCKELELSKLDFVDLERRVSSMVQKRNEHLYTANTDSSLCLRDFLQKGDVTLNSLYYELVSNQVYRTELEQITAIFNNPELKKKFTNDDSAMSIHEIMRKTNSIRTKLKNNIIGQDDAINKIEKAYFHNEKVDANRKGPKHVFLFAGPPGVGKTYSAELLAKALEVPYKRFDMSGYGLHESLDELEGISSFWKGSKPGVLTSYVDTHPKCVLLFDEIEKAHPLVIKLFLQIIDEGICIDRHYEKNISFSQCTIIFTTNAGRMLYDGAEKENLTLLSDKIVIDALEKDINKETQLPFFPPELISRLSSNTIIMFNHLNSSAIKRVILTNIDHYLKCTSKQYNININSGKHLIAATSQFAIGGSKDARNASKIAGKLISKELYELLQLVHEKTNSIEENYIKNVSFDCDFTGVDEKIVEFYNGTGNCDIIVFSDRDIFSKLFLPNDVQIKITSDIVEYQRLLKESKVLYTLIDYSLGKKESSKALNALDVKSDGKEAFSYVRSNCTNLPAYILMDDSNPFTEREVIGINELGAEGIIGTNKMFEEMEKCYFDVCCNAAVDSLIRRHQIISYKTRKEYDFKNQEGKIIFYDMKFETAIEAEDRSILLPVNAIPDISWDDIYVSSDIKDELNFFIDYLKNPSTYRSKGLRTPMGALMFGPRGTGKTSLAKVVAAESKLSFLSTTGAQLAAMSADEIHEIFVKARKYAPCVLFIDEIDAVGYNRKKYGINPNLNTILTEMDGFSTNDNNIVFVMGATNLGKELDPALVRRFDRNFFVNLPDKEGRSWMINRKISKNPDSFDVSEKEICSLVIRSEGLSLSDIDQVLDLALREGIRSNKTVDDSIIDEALEHVRYGEAKDDISEEDIKLIAYHEAGHAIIGLHNGEEPNYMSIVSRGDFGGYVSTEGIGKHPTKERMLNYICQMLGGRAAELEFGFGLTPGASSDLAKTTELAKNMVCSYGMYEDEVGIAVISEDEYTKNDKVKSLVNQILSEQLKEARRIIVEEQENIEKLANAVLNSKKKYLTKTDIHNIYKGVA